MRDSLTDIAFFPLACNQSQRLIMEIFLLFIQLALGGGGIVLTAMISTEVYVVDVYNSSSGGYNQW